MERPLRSGGPATQLDLADALCEFARVYPVWIERLGPHKGFPLSWQHFVYGLQHFNRSLHREKLRFADTIGVAVWGKPDAYRRWIGDESERSN